MSNLDVLTYGFAFTSDQGGLGWSTISLLTTGNRRILIDTGPASRRALLADALRSRNLDFEDFDTVILTHMHWRYRDSHPHAWTTARTRTRSPTPGYWCTRRSWTTTAIRASAT